MNLLDHLKDNIMPLITDGADQHTTHYQSDWLVNHTGYTASDDNALDMLETMHTLPTRH